MTMTMDQNKKTSGTKRALGRGLDALFASAPVPEVQTGGASAISEIELNLIEPNPEQPRRTFDPEALEELAASIRELGIVQPLTLRSVAGGRYQIIAGERRWRAATRAGLVTVPAYVRTASDSEMTEMALIENIQRQDLNAIEVALGFKKLIDSYSLTQERLSERLGKKRATIANHLRLLRLPAEIQLGLRDHNIEMGHARALLGLDNTKMQLKLYKRIVKEGLSVRAVEALVKKLNESQAPQEKNSDNEVYDELVKSLSTRFSAPVKFSRNAKGNGTITFKFGNDDDLHRLIKAFDSVK